MLIAVLLNVCFTHINLYSSIIKLEISYHYLDILYNVL